MSETPPPDYRVRGAYKAKSTPTIDGACCRQASAYLV